jgi:serine/threonine protein kinase
MAYEMLVGSRPFPEDDLQALLNLHLSEDIPDPSRTVANLPEGLCRFITNAGRCQPDQRYQNVRQALDDLKALVTTSRIVKKNDVFKNRKTASILMSYDEQQQIEFNRLLEEFSTKVRKLGVDFKIADSQER